MDGSEMSQGERMAAFLSSEAMSGLSAFFLGVFDRARGTSLYMTVSHAFMSFFDTTASFVKRQIIALPFSQLPYGAVEKGLQRGSEKQRNRDREKKEIKLEQMKLIYFPTKWGQISKVGWREGKAQPGI